MSQRLIIEDDEGTTTIVPLGKDAVTIGRQQGNTIQLTEKNVSRRHARLYPDHAAWIIEDLASYNGVKVNGVPIDGRVTLKEGDVVQIGDYHLALTEDVDKRTLNYPHGAVAANDGAAAVEPMLASSSTDLPRLTAEELAALQSGPHPVSQPALLDSGPVPATPMPMGFEERRKGGSGALVGFGVVVALALVGGIAWMAVGGGEEAPTTVAKADEAEAAAAKADEPPPPAEEVEEIEPTPTADPTAEAEVAPEPAEGGEPAEDPPEAGDDGEPAVVIPDDAQQPEDAPRQPLGSSTPKRNRNKPNKQRSQTKKDPGPPPAPTPAVDVAALMSDARRAALSEGPAKGYELASKALKAGGGRAAAKLMATCACRMKDAGKAKRAISRLSGAARDEVVALCRDKGITL
jgi:hypothetical protein